MPHDLDSGEQVTVILDPADYAAWLDPDTPPAEALALLRPCPSDRLVATHVRAG